MNSLSFIQPEPSAFAQLVDSLRGKSEGELKMLYLRFFQKELEDEWEQITAPADFRNASDEDIVAAISKNRYQK
ncbi:MAG: hypothetical protein V4539_10630 [Bacteroidota bacterium]